MNYPQENPYRTDYSEYSMAAMAAEDERTAFIRKTYVHLAGAIGLFVLLQMLMFTFAGDTVRTVSMSMTSGWNWLLVLGAFMVVSWIAQTWASSATSLAMQYLGLTLFVVAEAIIFLPILYVAHRVGDETIMAAAVMTGVVFGGLTVFVLVTRADFSGWGKYLWIGGLVALGMVVCSVFTGGMTFGVIVSAFIVALACGYILYHTSNVLLHYRTNQYVAASLALFASVAILFWHILRLVLAFSGRD